MKGWILALAALGLPGAAPAQVVGGQDAGKSLNSQLSGDLTVHDPVIIREGDTYYVFSTVGKYIGIKTSKDLKTWTDAGSVFAQMPAWTKEAVPGTEGIWAPDISYVNGEYRLYYSVSTFGSNRSAIGLATSPALGAKAKWKDHGLVVMSTKEDDFNAIDPNFVVDAQGRQWLSLGSFWSGLKLFPLDAKTGKVAPGTEPYSIARRLAPAGGPAPVEAPFIIPHGGWYYLLASYDYCCKGVNSTYYTVVGRAKKVTGPYLGKDGSEMMQGGGTIFLRADLQEQQRFRGPGHAGAFTDSDGTTYVVYHAYDKQADGAPKLRIAPIRWDADGWPTAEY
ncbi:arabinan endo-1,5-alpha-L-arabinosidase [Novosphingobium barchaimii LL02]|uniref:Extracellular exo-alpha-(1->5)-L-arabinofuranosidase n=1 Tax=Novosphingobium barchaimii LL02 TaxID=1114963 RepID=A0A0J7XFG6_9SPHN|nr:arabinan endo-1,5-alpha-L-arabinosidase [Novosphingobium barchaimii]KMS50522.1 arabinan endo-1,5-alpha-L-arabinosidase [Novosphingobium barchaimii LL02]